MGNSKTDPLVNAIRDTGEGWLALALTLWPDTHGTPPEWHQHAACRGTGSSLFFSGARMGNAEARRVCMACPVRRQCHSDVLEWEAAMPELPRPGITAGMTGTQRTQLRRQLRTEAA